MQVDISESKSRAFNIFLRFIQLSVSTIIANYISSLDSSTCNNSFFKFIVVVSYIMLAANILAILYSRCKAQFSKTVFYIFFSIDLILAGIILVVSFAGYGQSNLCANNKLFFKFAVLEVIFIVIMTIMILFMSFYWIQRYSNSPGNFGWIFLFFGTDSASNFSSKLTAIGVFCLLVSLFTLLSNGISAWKGITSLVKKIVIICWGISLLLMFINQIIAIVAYFSSSQGSSYDDAFAKKLLQTFLAINVIQFILWIAGLMTLKYQNGDPIRDTLLSFGKNEELNDQERNQEENNAGFGTIK